MLTAQKQTRQSDSRLPVPARDSEVCRATGHLLRAAPRIVRTASRISCRDLYLRHRFQNAILLARSSTMKASAILIARLNGGRSAMGGKYPAPTPERTTA